MTRRQHYQECALFALCTALGHDYQAMHRKYLSVHCRTWGTDSPLVWTLFTQEALHYRVTSDFFKGFSNATAVAQFWHISRFVSSFFPGAVGSAHLAYIRPDNCVEDGIFPHALPFAQYVRLLGERGGIITGYREV